MMYLSLIEDQRHIPLFEWIYRNYRTAMFGIAVAVLKDHHLAEDAVSEAYIKIAKNMKKISALDGQVRKDYIVILTRNSALDIYRQRKKQESVVDFLEELPDSDGSYTLEERIFSTDGYHRLVQAIHDLPVTYRDVMKLYYLFDHTAAEVAELLNIRVDTVNARLSRGRKKLAEMLAKEKEGSAP